MFLKKTPCDYLPFGPYEIYSQLKLADFSIPDVQIAQTISIYKQRSVFWIVSKKDVQVNLHIRKVNIFYFQRHTKEFAI